jgi:arginyl-tRNA synthetase
LSLYAQYSALLDGLLDDLVAEGALPASLDRRNVIVEPPRDPSHGDLATNAAMVLARGAGTNPRALAEAIKPKLEALPPVTSVEIAGPGFINLRLASDAWRDELRTILSDGEEYGVSTVGGNERVNVEYVSANPTGPLHMGHCRGAVTGDSLARLLEAAGFRVTKEYYVNDAGAQVDTLARSLQLRYREKLGENIGEIPEGLYPGDYLKPVGALLAAEFGDRFAEAPESDWLDLFRERAIKAMLDLIRHDLGLLDIHHDKFSSEAELQRSGAVEQAMRVLREKGLVYQGVLERPKSLDPHDEWEPVELTLFRSTEFGDDQDRPMKKSDGSWTYFGSDAAYHWQKAQDADHLVNIWGADHAGTVKRVQSAVRALTDGRVDLDVKIINMVRLFRGGEPVKMSKRAGTFISLDELIDEVGADAARFTLLSQSNDSAMAFDIDVVKRQSMDNPVYYVQYGHARTCRMMANATAIGMTLPEDFDPSLLDHDRDRELLRALADFPKVVTAAAELREPHRVARYLEDTTSVFNKWYDTKECRMLPQGDEPVRPVNEARLMLVVASRTVLANGLGLLGVSAPERM